MRDVCAIRRPFQATEEIGQIIVDKLAKPALLHGFAFMSIQTRHPTSSQCGYQTPSQIGVSPLDGRELPSTDIAAAVQFARYHSGKNQLNIDPNNIFLVGQSRGSAVILNALIEDQQGKIPVAVGDSTCDTGVAPTLQPYQNQSSKPNAVFATQAQTTYDNTQVNNMFVEPIATATVNDLTRNGARSLQFPQCVNGQQFSYQCHYNRSRQTIPHIANNPISALNALGNSQLNPNGVPIWIRYDRAPISTADGKVALYVNDAGDRQDAADIDNSLNCFEQSITCLDVHHPIFGQRLVDKYNSIAATLPVTSRTWVYAQYGNAKYGVEGATKRDDLGERFYENYYCFFLQYKRHLDSTSRQNITAAGNHARQDAVTAYNMSKTGSDPLADGTICTLSVDDDKWPAKP